MTLFSRRVIWFPYRFRGSRCRLQIADVSGSQRARKILAKRRAESPDKHRPEIPKGLCQAVLKCLEKDPDARFKSYAQLREALLPYAPLAETVTPAEGRATLHDAEGLGPHRRVRGEFRGP